jgi:hypothetical protein
MQKGRKTHLASAEMVADSEQRTEMNFTICMNMALIKKIEIKNSNDDNSRSSEFQVPTARWLIGRVPASGQRGPGSIPASSKNFFPMTGGGMDGYKFER